MFTPTARRSACISFYDFETTPSPVSRSAPAPRRSRSGAIASDTWSAQIPIPIRRFGCEKMQCAPCDSAEPSCKQYLQRLPSNRRQRLLNGQTRKWRAERRIDSQRLFYAGRNVDINTVKLRTKKKHTAFGGRIVVSLCTWTLLAATIVVVSWLRFQIRIRFVK